MSAGRPRTAIEPLEVHDAGAAAALLMSSHADYPAFVHVYPDPAVRRRALLPFLRASAADAARLSSAVSVRDDQGLVAVALWLPPGAFPWSALRKVRGLPDLARSAAADVRRFAAFARLGAAAERRHPREPHWYLEALGVHPRAQGRGWGRRVLAPTLAHADAAGLPCYVETSDPGNEAFYRRLDFEVVGWLTHLPGAPQYLAMRRPVR